MKVICIDGGKGNNEMFEGPRIKEGDIMTVKESFPDSLFFYPEYTFHETGDFHYSQRRFAPLSGRRMTSTGTTPAITTLSLKQEQSGNITNQCLLKSMSRKSTKQNLKETISQSQFKNKSI
jgi:hypothetical protein